MVAQGRLADAEPYYRQTLQCLHARLGILGSIWLVVQLAQMKSGPCEVRMIQTAYAQPRT